MVRQNHLFRNRTHDSVDPVDVAGEIDRRANFSDARLVERFDGLQHAAGQATGAEFESTCVQLPEGVQFSVDRYSPVHCASGVDMGSDDRGGTQLISHAYRAVAANCGLNRADVARLRSHHGIAKKIRYLSGTSPEYQRHVVDRFMAGDKDPLRLLAASLLIYDTVGFHEVLSRLHRAVGGIRKEVHYLSGLATVEQAPRLPDRLLILKLIVEQSTLLLRTVQGLSVVPGSGSRVKKRRHAVTVEEAASGTGDRLYAAAGLGLIAKNVRNVAGLQAEHHPTADEKQLAIALTKSARTLAASAVAATVHSFGQVDRACRFRSGARPNRRVITHSQPDGDAILASWLAERYLLGGQSVEVLFVPRGRVLGAYRTGDCLVDVGNTHDPDHMFFDHKPPALASRHDSYAARLVWDELLRQGHSVGHLAELVDAVHAGDSLQARRQFADALSRSRGCGFHNALCGAQASHVADADVYRIMRGWLDRHSAKSTR